MGRASLLLLAMLGLFLCFADAHNRPRISDLDRLVYKEQVRELHFFYNGNMDDAAAIYGAQGRSEAFVKRFNNVLSVFCPDPDFQGWFARGGPYGDSPLTARYRDTPAANTPLNISNLSVATIYNQFLPILVFANSSQHFFGMEIIDVYYGADGRLYADVKGTLHQMFFQAIGTPFSPTPVLAHSFGHYDNQFVYNRNGGLNGDGFWCMRKFNANTAFAPFYPPTSYNPGPPQMSNPAYLSDDTRPDPKD